MPNHIEKIEVKEGGAVNFYNNPSNTEQILDYESFIKVYNKSKFSTPLDIDLQFRSKEIEQFSKSISKSKILLITGIAGIGKTKFALEECNTFAKSNGYIFKAILGRSADLFNDIKSSFDTDDNFIILIDDANRVSVALDYILNYHSEKVQNGNIKIVLTVRDYAKDKINEKIPFEIRNQEIILKELEDTEISDIVKSNFNISNPSFLERITSIAKGNPRLAIMASIVAEETNSLESLYDVTSLYDKYFSSIKQDIDNFSDSQLLLTISIISFFRVIDKENDHQVEPIEKAFNLSMEDFWRSVDILHNLEVVDLYENSVVKISDQILSMYLFYKAVFVDKQVKIDIFLEHFFIMYQNKFIDILNPLLDIFNVQNISNVLRKPIDNLWEKYENDENNLIKIMKTFWFLKKDEILLFCSKKINNLEKENIDIDSIKIWEDISNNQKEDKILELLSMFKYSNEIEIAIELIIEYFKKKPTKFLEVITILTKRFGYRYDSYQYDYKQEEILIDTLWKFSKNGEDELLSKLFIRVSSELLKVEFEETKYKGNRTYQNIRYKLVERESIRIQRDNIFEKVFSLYSKDFYQKDILALINKYPELLGHLGISKVEEWDKNNILNFMDKNLDNHLYEDCIIVEKILKNYDRCNIKYDVKLKEKFKHHYCDIKNILMLDSIDISLENKEEKKTDWTVIEEIKKERLLNLVEGYSIDEWQNLFDVSKVIYSSNVDREEYKLKNNLEILFNLLLKIDRGLYIEVFTHYLKLENPFFLSLNIRPLIDILGKNKAYNLLKKYAYNGKNSYLFGFFISLKNNEIGIVEVERLLRLYKESKIKDITHNLDYIETYLDIQDDLFIQIVSIVLKKSKKDNKYIAHILTSLFNPYTKLFHKIEEYFQNNTELLKEVYLVSNKQEQHCDHTKEGLNKILNIDKSFLKDYLESYFEEKKYISSHNISGDYTLLWEREEYKDVFLTLIDTMFEITTHQKLYNGAEVIKTFFSKDIDGRVNSLLKKYITLYSTNEQKMIFIFELISELPEEIIIEMTKHFLEENSSFEIFKKLSFSPKMQSWSGSRIPSLQKELDFYNIILNSMQGIKFLEHKQNIKNKKSYILQKIEQEKKRDFMDD